MMKVTTDTTGKTTVELSASERKTLATTMTICDKVSYHLRTQEESMITLGVVEGIREMLKTPDSEKPDV